MLSFFKKSFFASPNKKILNKYTPLLENINNLENEIKLLSDENIRNKTFNFRKSLNKNTNLEEILPEAFAFVSEAAVRTLGQRHYDVQILGGIALHNGKIAEMKTGEGKTLVSTLPAYLNSLTGKGVHIVTVNDYLAKRDSEWMGKVFNFLGVSTGCITNDLEDIQRKKNYKFDPFL